MSWDENFFDNLEFEDIELDVDGTSVTRRVPIVQRDLSRSSAIFIIDAEKAQAKMSESVTPVRQLPSMPAALPEGKAMLQIAVTVKRDVEGMDPYTEVGFMVPCMCREEFCYYTIQMANTTEQAVAGVKALWNFSSFLCDVSVDETDDSITYNMEADGQHVMTFTTPKGETEFMTMPTNPVMVDPEGDVKISHGFQQFEACIAGGAGVSLELGDHPFATELSDLSLGPCFMTVYQPKDQYWLKKPE